MSRRNLIQKRPHGAVFLIYSLLRRRINTAVRIPAHTSSAAPEITKKFSPSPVSDGRFPPLSVELGLSLPVFSPLLPPETTLLLIISYNFSAKIS